MIKPRCNEEIRRKLIQAIDVGNVEVVKELVENQGAVITNVDYIYVVKYKQLEILKYFLLKNVEDSFYALDEAVKNGDYEAIQIRIYFLKKYKIISKK